MCASKHVQASGLSFHYVSQGTELRPTRRLYQLSHLSGQDNRSCLSSQRIKTISGKSISGRNTCTGCLLFMGDVLRENAHTLNLSRLSRHGTESHSQHSKREPFQMATIYQGDCIHIVHCPTSMNIQRENFTRQYSYNKSQRRAATEMLPEMSVSSGRLELVLSS